MFTIGQFFGLTKFYLAFVLNLNIFTYIWHRFGRDVFKAPTLANTFSLVAIVKK